ncbi:hypothetical protein [Mucilaginibacter rubeus]|uniref:Uncharacterized protein n=1 Tax=Mucilaginibacter rubeus TaxID=2027860 RepID=A0A5C1HW65_9SPHI|nr:hypothetical protein [Mucilaginibacter rubeus]QEM09038.1 hypothetical protein DEO27_003070 [Mucilaginibacter rubeus]
MENQKTLIPLPPFFVDNDVTTGRINEFASKKNLMLSQAIGKPDTKSIWYSKAHITQLLDEIERANGDGLRMYFGTYESGHRFEGQTCLLMYATRAVRQGSHTIHSDVIPEHEHDFADRSSIARDFSEQVDSDPEKERGFNFGSPCPPLCD